MMQLLFILIWTALFGVVTYFSWVKIQGHFKVYLIMAYNCLFLTGIFVLYPMF